MGDRVVTAARGSLAWYGSRAADLGSLSLTRGGETPEERDTWTFSARVLATDAFAITQRPLALVVPHPRGAWRWTVIDLMLEAGVARGRLQRA